MTIENEETTMRIKWTTKNRFRKLEVHERQTDDELLNQVLDKYNTFSL